MQVASRDSRQTETISNTNYKLYLDEDYFLVSAIHCSIFIEHWEAKCNVEVKEMVN